MVNFVSPFHAFALPARFSGIRFIIIIIIIVIIIDLITLIGTYLIGNLHLSQTVGRMRRSGDESSSYPLRSRGVSQEFAFHMTRL
jgi:hypothetical protein